ARSELLTNNVGIAGFGMNPATGDILMANLDEGTVRRLAYNSTSTGTPLPELLSQTGAFTSLEDLTPAPGIIPYEPNVTFWSDHAVKQRWFALRDDTSRFGFSENGNWSLPVGATWVKHFELELTR